MSGRAGRDVVERIYVTGKLVLETPAHFGSGDAEGLTDMPLLRDPLENRQPLLTGASIAGALRNYVHEYQHGYGSPGTPGDLADQLFGRVEGQASYQSWLYVDDALGQSTGVELRDGVAIDPRTRTAEEKKKYDTELLEAGTTFPLAFELLLPVQEKPNPNSDLLKEALALALHGLQSGEIGLGLRKRRGLGQCRVDEWRVRRYRLTTPAGVIGWLADDRSTEASGKDVFQLLGVTPRVKDARATFTIEATFQLTSSLLIRSGSGGADAPDMVHLRSRRGADLRPILSGTSLAGAVRGRALRIANTLLGRDTGKGLVDGMFGKRIETADDKPTGSRVVTKESELTGTRDWVQSRVKIDRFTGGSFPAALFTQQPAFGGNEARLPAHITIRQPRDAEVGLLLLVLKDLWTDDLPLGGESSVGRGRLQGQYATLTWRSGSQAKTWQLAEVDGHLEVTGDGTRDELEGFVKALPKYRRPDEE